MTLYNGKNRSLDFGTYLATPAIISLESSHPKNPKTPPFWGPKKHHSVSYRFIHPDPLEGQGGSGHVGKCVDSLPWNWVKTKEETTENVQIPKPKEITFC